MATMIRFQAVGATWSDKIRLESDDWLRERGCPEGVIAEAIANPAGHVLSQRGVNLSPNYLGPPRPNWSFCAPTAPCSTEPAEEDFLEYLKRQGID
ncbi:MAG: hypothetical protein ACREFQ_23630 [Stellaceae bacterium]